MRLRDYQQALDERRRASTARRVLVQLPTGAGKSHLIQRAAADYEQRLVLAHAEWLLAQLSALIPGQVITAGVQHSGDPSVIGMVQTIANRNLPAPELIIVDEAHHAVAGRYRDILGRYPNARVLGFTATPQRLDGLGLGTEFDELICGPSYGDLITAGWLKPFQVRSIPSGVDLTGARTMAGEFAAEDVKTALRRSTIFGDVVEHYLAHCRNLGGHASFWPSIEMAEAAAGRFTARGVRCAPLHSKLPRETVRALVRGLRDGVIDSLATVSMIGEGLDVPGLSSVSLCRPTKSLTVYLQQAGRCNRGGPGIALVMDHVANWQRHGLPDDDREWSLEGRVKRKAAPGTVSVWDCPSCWRVNNSQARECAGCGTLKPHELRELEQRAAELEVITRADLGDIHDLCSTAEEYVAFARAHGKRVTWAAYQWAVRGQRACDDNPFLAAAGELKPTRDEYLAAARECGVHLVAAREAAKARGLTW